MLRMTDLECFAGWCSVARGYKALKVHPLLVVRAAARARQAVQPLQAGCARPVTGHLQAVHMLVKSIKQAGLHARA